MATKSVYHKTQEMGNFEGKRFYTTSKDLMPYDKVYVISSKSNGNRLNPYLEGCFRVESVDSGEYEIKGRKFNYLSTLTPIAIPKEPINISNIRDKMGPKPFASRFMNEVKLNLSPIEINEFESLLLESRDNVFEAAENEESLRRDFQDILQSKTEREQLILARIGQGKFRSNVVAVWGLEKEVCVLTGISLPPILTASHIVPWRECVEEKAAMRWDGANGILMCAHIDRLFDQYYLSFKRNGMSCSIRYSDSLSDDNKQQLGLTRDLEVVPNRMDKADRERFFGYIEEHYNKFLEIEAKRNANISTA